MLSHSSGSFISISPMFYFTITAFKMIIKSWLLELNLWAGQWACVLSIPKPLIPFYKRLLFTHNNYFIVD